MKLNHLIPTLVFILLGAHLSSCEKLDLPEYTPNCIKRKIRKLKTKRLQNPPAKIWQWKVDNELYYYINSPCCDRLNYLYDDDCNEVCAPSGGFTGTGDGSCPDFNNQVESILIWEDKRS